MFGEPKLDSLRHVGLTLREALGERHELVFWPNEFAFHAPAQQRALVDRFVLECDVVVGYLNDWVLDARHRLRHNVPCVFHLLGGLARGAFGWRHRFPQLTTRDVLIANCSSDVALAAQLLRNARVLLVPFAYDDRTYYPLGEAERRVIRETLGFGPGDQILLYAGRITPEKNLHTVLRVFRGVLDIVPTAHLLLVGPIDGVPFHEFGVRPLHFAATIDRIAAQLEFPAGRVHMAGPARDAQLRALYNIADVVVNLTLNHDENFGLAQVEAMACGTPVVGTAWGGLKDTILEGVSGYKVATAVTPAGVKVNWWEAVNKTVLLLRDAALRERLRISAREHALLHYSRAAYRNHLETVVAAAAETADQAPVALEPTTFATEFFSTCDPAADISAPYRRGPRAIELYQRLMFPYTAATAASVHVDEPFTSDHVLCLATPISVNREDRLRLDDPLYPIAVEVPAAHRTSVAAILAIMSDEPVVTFARLVRGCGGSPCITGKTVLWMLEAGVLLRTRPMAHWVAPSAIDARVGKVLFTIAEVDRASTDFVVS